MCMSSIVSSESDYLRRVFLGSIPETVSESQIRAAASGYGRITSFHYSPSARGWALITFTSREEANSAVDGMNKKLLFSACTVPIVARIAHDKKTTPGTNQQQRQQQSLSGNVNSASQINNSAAAAAAAAAAAMNSPLSSCITTNAASNYHCPMLIPSGTTTGANRFQEAVLDLRQLGNMRALLGCAGGNNTTASSQMMVGSSMGNTATATNTAAATATGTTPTRADWIAYYNAMNPYYFNFAANAPRLTSGEQQSNDATAAAAAAAAAMGFFGASSLRHPAQLTQLLMAAGNPSFGSSTNEVLGARKYGPPGSNLFIFHIPSEWTHADLYEHFKFYGTIISARVKTASDSSNRNLGFGFVSYDSPEASLAAIKAMHGFHVNGKWLKVTLKKGEEYLLPESFSSVYIKNGTTTATTPSLMNSNITTTASLVESSPGITTSQGLTMESNNLTDNETSFLHSSSTEDSSGIIEKVPVVNE